MDSRAARVISREVFLRHENGRPVMAGFIACMDDPAGSARPATATILHRYGRSDYSDAYDDYVDILSRDNGATWSEPELHLKGYDVPEGKMRYGEQAALFDAARNRLIVIVNKWLYPKDTLDTDARYELEIECYAPASGTWSERESLRVDHPQGVAMSFCVPIVTSAGRLVFPGQTHYVDDQGKPVHYRGCWSPAGVITHLLGDVRADGSIDWHPSEPLYPDLERTSRGFYEPTIAELAGGRFAMILRGDNSMYPDRPGYKWLSFSDDDCQSWSEAVPLGCDEGEPIESSSTGSTLFRSILDGRLFWIGNLCIEGVRPNGNFPRSPLVIAEIQESPFAIRRETITVIDRQAPGEPPEVQHSNFRFYQERGSGDVVLFLSRFGERGFADKRWLLADYYQYRIALQE